MGQLFDASRLRFSTRKANCARTRAFVQLWCGVLLLSNAYLQILPRLKPGVLVHIHDIFLPADYPREAVLNNLWFWSEQYLLQAFLSFNSEFEVLWSSSTMQIECPQVLEKCFPSWRHSLRDMPKSKRRFVPTMGSGAGMALQFLDASSVITELLRPESN